MAKVRKGTSDLVRGTRQHRDRTKYHRPSIDIDTPEYREWHRKAVRDLKRIARGENIDD